MKQSTHLTYIAPYMILTGGGNWCKGHGHGNGSNGIGVEYRFVQNKGLFVDARYMYNNVSFNAASLRYGIRVNFNSPYPTFILEKFPPSTRI